ncbi:hypothetical protein CCP3SC15_150028 [Gammaproteobacteria bacterium]
MTTSERREELSSEVHKCYCRAYERRFGKPYWTNGDYSKLDEATKDYDREMADYLISRERSLMEKVREPLIKADVKIGGVCEALRIIADGMGEGEEKSNG